MAMRRSRTSDLFFKLTERIIREHGHKVPDMLINSGKAAGKKLDQIWYRIRSRKPAQEQENELLCALNLARLALEEEKRAHAATQRKLEAALRKMKDANQ